MFLEVDIFNYLRGAASNTNFSERIRYQCIHSSNINFHGRTGKPKGVGIWDLYRCTFNSTSTNELYSTKKRRVRQNIQRTFVDFANSKDLLEYSRSLLPGFSRL